MVLSYRHAFHAGNRGDVFKHAVMLDLLRAEIAARARTRVVETHAGAGLYALRSGKADERREWAQGIGKAWDAFAADVARSGGHGDDAEAKQSPGPLQELVRHVAQFNNSKKRQRLDLYPGSPLLTLQMLRDQDEAVFYELHASDMPVLQWHCASPGRHVLKNGPKIELGDGLAGLRAEATRADLEGCTLAFIDPPYEVKSEYNEVARCVLACAAANASMTIALWYPLILGMDRAETMVQSLCESLKTPWVDVREQAPNEGAGLERGMWGSGVLVVNPESRWLAQAGQFGDRLGRDAAQAFGSDHVVRLTLSPQV
ncbi:Hypothetical Protein FCC1311_076682 [Hondaea fermentalgiana]|uniref:Ribosomal RNA large subunit methyltransferase J n=1 Tax=Hondaea fermentalgiana TaxID=2315210 RepID=A0A2R5GU74_9STRA|nr:Hypothetical Protein FCC1311_076682 [Hondaea fermentalgiana]|eukprot:GBG31444.1 Hypothetical Protein FCC1311_076682 [Hondaea fermentalgiana]